MQVTVTKPLNIRVGAPNLDAACYQYLAPGSKIIVDGKLYEGEDYDGNTLWYRDLANNYYWSGGVLDSSLSSIPEAKKNIDKYWWLKDYNIDKLWNKVGYGSDVRIAVLDTGLSLPHEDLDSNSIFYTDVSDSNTIDDWTGHGTHVCGIIKASHNLKGVFGISPESKVFFAKVTNDIVGDKIGYLVKAINWAIKQKVDIISISRGFENDSVDLKNVVSKAIEKNIFIISAAGNKIHDNHLDINFPARYPKILSVGGLVSNKMPLNDTLMVEKTDVFAPGYEILSTFKTNSFDTMSGSSQATPFVAGVSALLLSHIRKKQPSFKAINLLNHILSTSDSESFGKVINPLNSLNQIL